ncbi:MAG: hypothetical protein H6924_05270 [Alphaproteobacteria bacterium]|nr:hypothetical protein [Alphaproteobacteria bacterium]
MEALALAGAFLFLASSFAARGFGGVFSIRFRTSSRLGVFVMPQPLSKVVRDNPGCILIGNGEEAARPELAALAFSVIAAMSTVDSLMARLVASITAGKSKPIIDYFVQSRNDARKEAMIKALALSHLRQTRLVVFNRLWKEYQRVQSLRNPIAHHLWGTCEKLAYDAVVCSDPRKTLSLDSRRADLRDQISKAKKFADGALLARLEREEAEMWRDYQATIMVYREKDFRDIIRDMANLRGMLFSFNRVVESDAVAPKEARQIFRQLTQQPEYRSLT